MSRDTDFANMVLMHDTAGVLAGMQDSGVTDAGYQQVCDHLKILADAAKGVSINTRMRYAQIAWKDILAINDNLPDNPEAADEGHIQTSFDLHALTNQLKNIVSKQAS